MRHRVSTVQVNGQRLAELMAAAGLSVTDVAERAQVSTRTVGKMLASGWVSAGMLRRVHLAIAQAGPFPAAELVRVAS